MERAPGGHPPTMGTIGRWSCVRWGRVACLLVSLACGPARVGVMLIGCGEPSRPDDDGGPGGWLAACGSDAECGSDARCLGGVCTLACGASELHVCGGLNEDAACDTMLGACVVPCGVSMACQVLGSGYVCDEGRCRPRRSH